MPAGMNYAETTLGLAVCQPEVLAKEGLTGCPANSRLGFGSAFVEVPFGNGAGTELPEIQAVMGPSSNGNIVVLFYANGKTPVSAQLVFKAKVQPASSPFGPSCRRWCRRSPVCRAATTSRSSASKRRLGLKT